MIHQGETKYLNISLLSLKEEETCNMQFT